MDDMVIGKKLYERLVEPIAEAAKTNKDGDTYTPGPCGPRDIGIYKDKPAPAPQRLAHEKKALDVQIGGNHYKQFKIQPAEFCQRNKLDWCQSNVIKYVCRHEFKNGLEDLKKAKHYIDLLIQMEYEDDNGQGIQAE